MCDCVWRTLCDVAPKLYPAVALGQGSSPTYIQQARNAVSMFLVNQQDEKIKSLDAGLHRIMQLSTDETEAEIWLDGDHGSQHLMMQHAKIFHRSALLLSFLCAQCIRRRADPG